MATIKKGLLFLLLNVIVLVLGAPVVEASGLAARQDPDFQCEFRTLETVMLQSFNIHRANHSVGPLEWNETLATAALNTVQFGPDLVHDNSGKDWGQTLYAWYWSDPNYPGLEPQAAVSSWYNDEFQRYQAYGEASKLDLEHNPSVNSPPATPPGSVYGHFTQVIWKDTKTVGCAAWPKKSSDEKYYGTYVACNYYPGGNYVTNDNTWVDNVLPPRGDDVLEILCGGVPILPPNVDDPPA